MLPTAPHAIQLVQGSEAKQHTHGMPVLRADAYMPVLANACSRAALQLRTTGSERTQSASLSAQHAAPSERMLLTTCTHTSVASNRYSTARGALLCMYLYMSL